MKICIYGTWHLGTVTAACLASKGYNVTGLDPNRQIIQDLSNGIPPLFEPGLQQLIQDGLANGKLRFSTDVSNTLEEVDLVWICFDTPVDDSDQADTGSVIQSVKNILPFLKSETTVLVSSQLPVGSVTGLSLDYQKLYPNRKVYFACSPENLRLGSALKAFNEPGRIVVGVDSEEAKARIEPVLKSICDTILWMSVPSAEMVKHALNGFLATSICFANEVATVCELTGADAKEVERGLKSDPRVGPRAYVAPGQAFGGGTLARDINYLVDVGIQNDVNLPLLSSVLPSNERHRDWHFRKLISGLNNLNGKRIGLLGLSYKPGTSSIRRSTAVTLAKTLASAGASVVAYDPYVTPACMDQEDSIEVATSLTECVSSIDALIVATVWPELDIELLKILLQQTSHGMMVLDANRAVEQLAQVTSINYLAVGTSQCN